MNADFAEYAEIDFSNFIVWGELDRERFELRLNENEARVLSNLQSRQAIEIRETLLGFARQKKARGEA